MTTDAFGNKIEAGDWVFNPEDGECFCVYYTRPTSGTKWTANDGNDELHAAVVNGVLHVSLSFETIKLFPYEKSADAKGEDRVVFVDNGISMSDRLYCLLGKTGTVNRVLPGFIDWTFDAPIDGHDSILSAGRQLAKLKSIDFDDGIQCSDMVLHGEDVFKVGEVKPLFLQSVYGEKFLRRKCKKISPYKRPEDVKVGDTCVILDGGIFSSRYKMAKVWGVNGRTVSVSNKDGVGTFSYNSLVPVSHVEGVVKTRELDRCQYRQHISIELCPDSSLLGLFTMGKMCCEVIWNCNTSRYEVSGRDREDKPFSDAHGKEWKGLGEGWEKVKKWKSSKKPVNIGWDPL